MVGNHSGRARVVIPSLFPTGAPPGENSSKPNFALLTPEPRKETAFLDLNRGVLTHIYPA